MATTGSDKMTGLEAKKQGLINGGTFQQFKDIDLDFLTEITLFSFFCAMVCRIYTSAADPRWLIIVAIGTVFAAWFIIKKFLFPMLNSQKIQEQELQARR